MKYKLCQTLFQYNNDKDLFFTLQGSNCNLYPLTHWTTCFQKRKYFLSSQWGKYYMEGRATQNRKGGPGQFGFIRWKSSSVWCVIDQMWHFLHIYSLLYEESNGIYNQFSVSNSPNWEKSFHPGLIWLPDRQTDATKRIVSPASQLINMYKKVSYLVHCSASTWS